jgi:hypothetical protein
LNHPTKSKGIDAYQRFSAKSALRAKEFDVQFLGEFGGLAIWRIADIQVLNEKWISENDQSNKIRHYYTL